MQPRIRKRGRPRLRPSDHRFTPNTSIRDYFASVSPCVRIQQEPASTQPTSFAIPGTPSSSTPQPVCHSIRRVPSTSTRLTASAEPERHSIRPIPSTPSTAGSKRVCHPINPISSTPPSSPPPRHRYAAVGQSILEDGGQTSAFIANDFTEIESRAPTGSSFFPSSDAGDDHPENTAIRVEKVDLAGIRDGGGQSDTDEDAGWAPRSKRQDDDDGSPPGWTGSLGHGAGDVTDVTMEDAEDIRANHTFDVPVDEATRRTAASLTELLVGDWEGCSEEVHRQRQHWHEAREGANHHDLSATYEGLPEFGPDCRTDTGLYSDGFPRNQGMPRKVYPAPDILSNLFEGRMNPEEKVRNICLHMEEAPPTAPTKTFDIDSVLLFPRTLAAFSRTMRWCIAKQIQYNIHTDLHLDIPVKFYGADGKIKSQRKEPREIPHLFLGTVDGIHFGSVYLFFPWLIREERTSTYLTDDQARRFTDEGMLRAVKDVLEPDRLQHFPPTQGTAELNARAKATELLTESRERGLRSYASYPLQAETLGPIWDRLQELIGDPDAGLGDFRDAFLFVNVKGAKLDFKVSGGSLFRTLGDYEARLSDVFRLDLMARKVTDIGAEVCPPAVASIHDRAPSGGEAVSYLWKRCCLERQYHHFRDHGFEGKKGRVQYYHVGFLGDTACMTLAPPKTGGMYSGGWLYGQWYSSVKEIVDAQGCYPFANNPRLPELALDEGIWKANVTDAKRSHLYVRNDLVRNLNGAKQRVRNVFPAAEGAPTGLRVEVRVEWETEQEMKRLAGRAERCKHVPGRLLRPPESAYALRTRNYTRFMLANYEKIVSTIEMASITSPSTGVTLERTRLMSVLFKCLQRFANGDLARESALWVDRRGPRNEQEGAVDRWGVAFSSTIPQHGFGWFRPVVDWEEFRFKREIRGELAGLDPGLMSWYRRGSHLIRDTAEELLFCFERLDLATGNPVVQDEIGRLMAHLCFRQYRRDVLKALYHAKDLRHSVEPDDPKDAIQFCHEGFREIVVGPLHFLSGNKARVKSPEPLFRWLWGSSSEYPRAHFVDRPFRIMYEKAKAKAEEIAGFHERWLPLFKQEWKAFHWVVPYPDANGSLISTIPSGGKRQWWALDWGLIDKKKPRLGHGWIWAKNRPRKGRPAAYPAVLQMDQDEVAAYLDKLALGKT